MRSILAVTKDASFIASQFETNEEMFELVRTWLTDPWYSRREIVRFFVTMGDGSLMEMHISRTGRYPTGNVVVVQIADSLAVHASAAAVIL